MGARIGRGMRRGAGIGALAGITLAVVYIALGYGHEFDQAHSPSLWLIFAASRCGGGLGSPHDVEDRDNGDRQMITVVFLVVIVLLLAATPWHRLPMAGRLWAVAIVLNTLIFFGMPTTLATSPWRPVVGRMVAASAAAGLALLVLGLLLRNRAAAADDWGPWAALLILGAHTLTVVGLVPDTRYRDLRDARPSIYFPLGQSFFPMTPTTLAIGTDGRPAELVSTIRRVISETEPGVALADATPFETFLEGPLAQPRLNAFLLVGFAGAAVTLAAIGLFGVMVTMVRHRTRELGIRLALGAEPRHLRRMVMRRGLAIGAAGLVPGILGALLANQLLAALLYQVSPTDGATLAVAAGLLLSVAGLASAIPARFSTRVDPVSALRAE